MKNFGSSGLKSLVSFSLFLIAVLSGCSFFDLNDMQSAGENLLNGQKSGSANVAFNIVIPGRASLSPVIRAADTGAKVTFRITLLQPGDTKNPTVTFLKTATVQSDGSATTSFSGLPEGSAIGEISIDGGNIGGKSMFHGASDLFPGNNTITVSPKGSLHESDILANAMLAIAADPEMLKIAKPNLVTNATNIAATLLANPGENIYTKVLESITNSALVFDSTKYTQIIISTPDGTVSGQGLTSWHKTSDQFWQGTQLSGSGILPVNVLRQGTGDYALVLWQNQTKNNTAFSKFSATGGTLLNYIYSTGTNGFIPQGSQILPGDGSIIIAGSFAGKPALVRWNGKENTDLSSGLTASGLTWNSIFEISSIDIASAAISYLEYDKVGTGKILCSIKDPSAGNRLFFVDPNTGVATEQNQNNNFGLWAQVGSGSIALGWDGLDAATSYKVYYATGTALATQTAPMVSTNEKMLLFENFVNNQVYSFQVAAVASEGHTLAWSTLIEATPAGAADPIIYSNWKLASNTFEIGSAALAKVRIISYDENSKMLQLEITETIALGMNSIITGVHDNKPLCVKIVGVFMPTGGTPPPSGPPTGPTQPGTVAPGTYQVPTSGASMEEVFETCKYVFKGKMSQLPAMSERLLSPADPLYQSKIMYLRRGGMRRSLRAGLTRPISADPSLGDLSLEIDNFELDPDVVVDFSTSFGSITQFEIRVDGYATCDVYLKLLASAAVELPALEGTLLPHSEIPFFVGPVPGTWGREITASWKMSLKAEAELKAGTKMRVDFRSGVNYFSESGWNGQLLWRVKNTPIFEAKLQGTFTNEAAIEMKNSLKVGGLAGPELTLKPYIKSEATISTDKPCQLDAALSMGMQGELKAIVQAWSYNIGEWGSTFEPFGPLVIASRTFSANATPTLKVTGAVNLKNEIRDWPWSDGGYVSGYPHICTTTGTDSIKLAMDDSKGLNKGLSKVEVSIDNNPPFLIFTLASETITSGYTMTPYPVQTDLILSLPLNNDENMFSGHEDQFYKWYTPFRLLPGPHEFEFKVYDKCGDFSIATHAVLVAPEEQGIWKATNSAGSETWQIGISGFEKGNLPERARTVEPVPDAFSIVPVKDGVVKHYDYVDGKLIMEGAFENNIRTGVWNKFAHSYQVSSYKSFVHQIEFADGGQPVSWLNLKDYAEESMRDHRLKIDKTPSGAAQFTTVATDTGYIYQDLLIDSFTTGIRTIGFEFATCSYDIETFVGGQRNGIATHSLYLEYESTVVTEHGEYSGNLKTGKWVQKIFKNVTELYSTTENNFSAGILNGEISYALADGSWTITGAYTQGARSGTWIKKVFENAELYSTTVNNFSAGILNGEASYARADGSAQITGAYTQGVRSGTWSEHSADSNAQVNYKDDLPEGTYSLIYSNGNHVSGSYAGGQPIGTIAGKWSIRDTNGNWTGSHTVLLDPISTPEKFPESPPENISGTSSTPEADDDWIKNY